MKKISASDLAAHDLWVATDGRKGALAYAGSAASKKNKKKISAPNLAAILGAHALWVATEGREGTRADLRYADLRGADLRGADLRDADLTGADLRGCRPLQEKK